MLTSFPLGSDVAHWSGRSPETRKTLISNPSECFILSFFLLFSICLQKKNIPKTQRLHFPMEKSSTAFSHSRVRRSHITRVLSYQTDEDFPLQSNRGE